MPISVGDSRTFHRGLMPGSMLDIMETCQRGMVDYTFLGGAQIDMYGNLNSTMIGEDYHAAEGALPGQRRRQRPGLALLAHHRDDAAGQAALRAQARLPHLARATSTGPGAREAAGLPPGTGPYRVITDLCVHRL